MSSDEADTKTVEDEMKDKSVVEENGESDAADEKVNNKTSKKKGADPPKIKQPAKKRVKTEQAEKESKKEEKKAKEEVKDDEEDDENDESAEENDVDNQKAIPLLDQPLEVEGSRRRKEVQRFIPPNSGEENKEVQIPEGKGKPLGDIEIIDFNIQRAKAEDLKFLHRLCFAKPCKAAILKKNIKKFYGYDFEEASDEYERRKTVIGKNKKVTVAQLKNVANILDIEKSGTKDDILERILSFLVCPVDAGKKLPGVGRSKRSGATSKNYDEGDERFSSKKRNKAKKKSEESEDSEKEKTDDEDSEKPKKTEKNQNTEVIEEPEVNDEEQEEEEEEEEEEKKPKKGAKKGKKAAEKKAPPKRKAAAKKAVEKSESEKDEESDEDAPLAKKSKTPPTDEEIKTYVKSLLDGANLELITMKKVCHDVYAHYPDFDLGHKKDFIKTTVKSLISS